MLLLYFLHSLTLLALPRTNPELYRSVTAAIPHWLQRVSAFISMLAMAALLTQMSLAMLWLLLFWAAVGVVLYVVARMAPRRSADASIAEVGSGTYKN